MNIKIVVNNMPPNPNYDAIVSLIDMHKLENSSCKNIDLGNCLDCTFERKSALEIIVKKLRYGGTIQIEGVDLLEVARNIVLGNITMDEAQPLLFNTKTQSSRSCLNTTINFLTSAGLKILQQTIINNQYYIKAERPKHD